MAYRIAVIEDDQTLRQNYAEAFEKQGYQVDSYATRSQAEHIFQSRLPDLAIIDIGLGDEIDGGYALCQWLRKRSEKLPIIYRTLAPVQETGPAPVPSTTSPRTSPAPSTTMGRRSVWACRESV